MNITQFENPKKREKKNAETSGKQTKKSIFSLKIKKNTANEFMLQRLKHTS